MYPESLTAPMKADLTSAGFQDLSTAQDVEVALAQKGVTLLVVNSVCGCAAGAARPSVKLAVSQAAKRPDHLVTVFAGVDKEATAKAREYMLPFPPSSPSIALFKDGEVLHVVERHHIEGRSAQAIAQHLVSVFEEVCA
ncbi:BrxA/BrxB family bacilliredoxin [Hugenholtzia roseola]|uniref:BrxA/BrxB family bacilliredoxin n=1 Tax=Hugenholtzia roseola TaxID=1002 RepID=UPI000408E3B4|nr:BrxA/BrxB family bacilliredoxin [Hugenholtzia roseola]